MRVVEIVTNHLKTNGFGGLFNGDAPCGCELGNIVPCGGDFSQCKPGYKHMDPRPENTGGWAIWKTKEAPKPEDWEIVEF